MNTITNECKIIFDKIYATREIKTSYTFSHTSSRLDYSPILLSTRLLSQTMLPHFSHHYKTNSAQAKNNESTIIWHWIKVICSEYRPLFLFILPCFKFINSTFSKTNVLHQKIVLHKQQMNYRSNSSLSIFWPCYKNQQQARQLKMTYDMFFVKIVYIYVLNFNMNIYTH